jgi:hypothetical protein
VPQFPAKTGYRRCPRCGSRLAHDERMGPKGRIARLLFLRALRCKPDCGWRGFRFSRSLYRRRRRRLMYALFVVIFIVTAAWAVRCVLSRASTGQGGAVDDGVREVD